MRATYVTLSNPRCYVATLVRALGCARSLSGVLCHTLDFLDVAIEELQHSTILGLNRETTSRRYLPSAKPSNF